MATFSEPALARNIFSLARWGFLLIWFWVWGYMNPLLEFQYEGSTYDVNKKTCIDRHAREHHGSWVPDPWARVPGSRTHRGEGDAESGKCKSKIVLRLGLTKHARGFRRAGIVPPQRGIMNDTVFILP